jgi:hypothetical protein
VPRELPTQICFGKTVVVSKGHSGPSIFRIKVIRCEFNGVRGNHPMLDGFNVQGRIGMKAKPLPQISNTLPL